MQYFRKKNTHKICEFRETQKLHKLTGIPLGRWVAIMAIFDEFVKLFWIFIPKQIYIKWGPNFRHTITDEFF